MQITDRDPTGNGKSLPVRENIFALGDCTKTSLNEEKGILAIKFLAYTVVGNVMAIVHGGKP